MDFGARTDLGRVRENNEDSFRLAPELNLFVLSDGMGGQASGEVASRVATETIVAHCREAESDPSLPLVGQRDRRNFRRRRIVSPARFAHANSAVLQSRAMKIPNGTAWARPSSPSQFVGERMSLAHVGDSRAYRLRSGELEQLTQDHSFVAEQVRRGIMTAEGSGAQQATERPAARAGRRAASGRRRRGGARCSRATPFFSAPTA